MLVPSNLYASAGPSLFVVADFWMTDDPLARMVRLNHAGYHSGPDRFCAGARLPEHHVQGASIGDPSSSNDRQNSDPHTANARAMADSRHMNTPASGLKLMETPDDNPDTDHDFVDFAETFLSSEPFSERRPETKLPSPEQAAGSLSLSMILEEGSCQNMQRKCWL